MNLHVTLVSQMLCAALGFHNPTAPQEKVEEGFVAIFNGKDLSGFKVKLGPGRPENNEINKKFDNEFTKTFTVKDRVLHVSGTPGGHLYTEKVYRNYVLRFDWKFPDHGNSGCFIHMNHHARGYWVCHEVQGLETDHGFIQWYGDFTTDRGAQKNAIKVGEWNTTEIITNDGRVTSKVNGVQVGTGDGHLFQGHIGFQSEGDHALFKNIRIKVLD